MPPNLSGPNLRPDATVLFCGAAGLFVVAWMAARIVAGPGATAGRRAFAQWFPIASAAAALAFLGRGEMAFSLVFSTSVALLSIVTGFVGLSMPLDEVPPSARPIYTLAPAVGILAFFVGMRGVFSWFEAMILAVQGAVVYFLWTGVAPSIPRPELDDDSDELDLPMRTRKVLIALQTTLLVTVALIAAYASAVGALHIGRIDPRFSMIVIAGTVLTLALTLPIISASATPIARLDISTVVTSNVITVVLNLCVSLPLCLITLAVGRFLRPWPQLAGQGFDSAISKWFRARTLTSIHEASIHFPMSVWRLDSVSLVVLLMLLIPLAQGMVKLDRRLSSVLIVSYGLFLLTVMVLGLSGS